MEPWMGQVGVAGALVGLLVLLGRTFIASVDRRVTETRVAHEAEIQRLIDQHKRELGDMRERAISWETAANRREATVNELVIQNGRLQGTSDTAVQLLKALHQVQGGRELESG
jgi:hypothetical protein